MKKVFLVFMSLMFIICLAGCREEKIKIDFIIDGKSNIVEIDDGTSITKDIIPLSNEEEVVELYYDENMENEYDNKPIKEDTKIYVKILNEKKEKIKIDFIIDGKSNIVEIDKGTSISKDIIPLSNEEEVVELYYDENMENEYDNKPIKEDMKIYVKILNENKDEYQPIGKFYTLQEAYIEEFITVEELQIIAKYHNNWRQMSNDLDPQVIKDIKEIAAYNLRNDELSPMINAKADDFIITKYYGTYNKCVVFMIEHPDLQQPGEELDITETIAGVIFEYSSLDRIIVWINSK